MIEMNAEYLIKGQVGYSGHLKAFLGFAPANVLNELSYPDVINEETGLGYQERIKKDDGKAFKAYIELPDTSSPPLVFNLRKESKEYWEIQIKNDNYALLKLKKGSKCFVQIDGQHRLSELSNNDVSFAFMSFIELDIRIEMALFYVINNKARGFMSLKDFTQDPKLLDEFRNIAPQLLLTKKINEDPSSPWYSIIIYQEHATSGLRRKVSFRMMQNSIKKILNQTIKIEPRSIEIDFELLMTFWKTIKQLFNHEWKNHRHYLITKGLGLYSLSLLLSDIVVHLGRKNITDNEFYAILKPLKKNIDWKLNGKFSQVRGKTGIHHVHNELRRYITL